MAQTARTLGELRRAGITAARSVKDEIRTNLLRRLKDGGPVFPGVVGYDDTVVPQIVNALLSRHNFIRAARAGQVAHPALPHRAA